MSPRTVVVAGGTSGINLAIARRFVDLGDRVAVLSRSQDKVDAAVSELGDESLGFAADVRDFDARRHADDTCGLLGQQTPSDLLPERHLDLPLILRVTRRRQLRTHRPIYSLLTTTH